MGELKQEWARSQRPSQLMGKANTTQGARRPWKGKKKAFEGHETSVLHEETQVKTQDLYIIRAYKAYKSSIVVYMSYMSFLDLSE